MEKTTMPRPYLSFAALLTLLFLFAQSALADRLYQIDIMVFANNDPSEAQSESWPQRLHLRYPQTWLEFGDEALPLAPRPAEAFRQVAESMRLSSRYRILLEQSWLQSLQPRQQSPAIVVTGGRQVGAQHELEGYLRVAVERYLYVETDLWFSRFGPGNGDYYLPTPPRRNKPAEDDFVDDSFENSPEYQAFLQQNPQLRPGGTEPSMSDRGSQNIDRIVVMKQSRRMRSDELHFIDHPLFGALVYISKPDLDALRSEQTADPSVPADTMGQQ